ncbi:MAG: FAD-binding oxidoreductase, partial [Acidimicrobiales bacterium]
QRPLATRADWYVLVRFSGSAPVVDRLAAHLAEASARGTVIDAVVAATPEQEQNLWLIRDGLSPPSLFDGRVSALKTDTAVPVDVVATHLTRCHAAVAEIAPDSVPCSFGHVGDGNIHMHVLVPADQEDRFLEVRPRLRARLDEITWELGGTISAEHGVGRELRERIAGQKSPVEIELMRRVKDMLDSDGLLNPGKTLPAG